MPNGSIEYVFATSPFPSRHDLPPRVADLLPAWDRSGALATVTDFDGYVIAATDRYRQLLGWSAQEQACAPYWEFCHPDQRDSLVEDVDQGMTSGGLLVRNEARWLGRDGRYRWIQSHTVAEPSTNLMYGIGTDITDQKPAMTEPPLLIGVFAYDFEAGVPSWSDEMYVMYGLATGTPLTDDLVRSHIHEQDLPLVDGAWRASLADHDAHAANFRAIRTDGSIRHLRSVGRVMSRRGGSPVSILGLTFDLSEQATY